jgi:hypothetical protein
VFPIRLTDRCDGDRTRIMLTSSTGPLSHATAELDAEIAALTESFGDTRPARAAAPAGNVAVSA